MLIRPILQFKLVSRKPPNAVHDHSCSHFVSENKKIQAVMLSLDNKHHVIISIVETGQEVTWCRHLLEQNTCIVTQSFWVDISLVTWNIIVFPPPGYSLLSITTTVNSIFDRFSLVCPSGFLSLQWKCFSACSTNSSRAVAFVLCAFSRNRAAVVDL